MTHHEATKDDKQGFASTCPGELAPLGVFHDSGLDPETRKAVPRTTTVYRCDCGCDLSVTSTGVVLNVYRRPDPARIAAELAARIGLRRIQ